MLSEYQSGSREAAQQWGMAFASCPLHSGLELLEARILRSGRKHGGRVGVVMAQSIPEEIPTRL